MSRTLAAINNIRDTFANAGNYLRQTLAPRGRNETTVW
jgi:hypothetical protein